MPGFARRPKLQALGAQAILSSILRWRLRNSHQVKLQSSPNCHESRHLTGHWLSGATVRPSRESRNLSAPTVSSPWAEGPTSFPPSLCRIEIVHQKRGRKPTIEPKRLSSGMLLRCGLSVLPCVQSTCDGLSAMWVVEQFKPPVSTPLTSTQ